MYAMDILLILIHFVITMDDLTPKAIPLLLNGVQGV